MEEFYDRMDELNEEEFHKKAEEIMRKIEQNLHEYRHFILYCDKDTYENFYNITVPEVALHRLFVIDPQRYN